jgi:hypothetical protein
MSKIKPYKRVLNILHAIIKRSYKFVIKHIVNLFPIGLKNILLYQWETICSNSPWTIKLRKEVPFNPKIGMAVLAYERPDYLEACLEALFSTNLYNYDITFLLQDDGSSDPRVEKIINQVRGSKYKIIRYFTKKGHHSAGAAINKAMNRLMEIDSEIHI